MHIPDGLINPGISAAAGVISAGGVGWSVSRARRSLTDRLVPLSALLAAFVFALQLINFPVVPGMSGHLIGGALTAILIGPGRAVVVMSVVVISQALLLADGGLSALGLNLFNLALVTPLAGYLVFFLGFKLAGSKPKQISFWAGVGAWASLPIMVVGFGVQFALGGEISSLSVSAIWTTLLLVHGLIGTLEATVTFSIVAVLMRTRPDLVHVYLPFLPSHPTTTTKSDQLGHTLPQPSAPFRPEHD